MTLVRTLLPCGIYADSYQRYPGELEETERRSERRATDLAAIREQPETPQTLHGLLGEAMRSNKMSPQMIADRLGVKVNSVYQWTSGKAKPNNTNLQRLCGALGIDYMEARRLAGADPVAFHGSDRARQQRERRVA